MKNINLLLTLLLTLNLSAQQTYVPDDNFEAYLEANSMGNGINNDDYVTTSNISGQTSLFIMSQGISDLTGIEDFTSLLYLECFDNQLTSINLSQNTSLYFFGCNNNLLTTLDISQNLNLGVLNCANNQLTNLDVSMLTNLTELGVGNNPLSSINISNNTLLESLLCYNIQITSINLSSNSALNYLDCSYNQLSELDLSSNPNLQSIYCQFNTISSLDASNTLATTISCYNNNLTCLSANNGLQINLSCENNNFNCVSVYDPFYTFSNASYDPWVNFSFTCTPTPIDNDINQGPNSLIAEQNNAIYQWLDCSNNYGIINGENNQTFIPTNDGFYAVQITTSDACGVMLTDTSSCHFFVYTSVPEFEANAERKLVKITDLLGRETKEQPNILLIYIFSDGTVEKTIRME